MLPTAKFLASLSLLPMVKHLPKAMVECLATHAVLLVPLQVDVLPLPK